MRLVISLTSISHRLPILRHTILSLLDQSLPPDRIVLNISNTPYLHDEGIQELPNWLAEFESSREIEISWVDNTGPYRKLIPEYQIASQDDWIVTCDDDVIYGPRWLATLVETAKKHPNYIVCGRARQMVKNILGKRQSYLNWPIAPPNSIGYDLLPIGISGILYRPYLLDRDIMSSRRFLELAPKQDDLWFNLARQRTGTRVVVSPETDAQVYPIETPTTLSSTNLTASTKQWERFFYTLCTKAALRAKAYLGMKTCGNDIALELLGKFYQFDRNHFARIAEPDCRPTTRRQ